MKNKGKTRRLKMAAWAAFMLPLIGLASNDVETHIDEKVDEVCQEEEIQYCASGPTTFYSGFCAWDADYYEQPKFVFDYFSNLDLNMPTNNVGNCGYVALTMLLSYYDTYWNGDIIPAVYNNPNQTVISSLADDLFDSPGVTDYHAPLYLKDMPEPDKNSDPKYIDEYDAMEYKAYSDYLESMLGRTGDTFISRLYEIALNRQKKWGSEIWQFNMKGHRKPAISVTGLKELARRYFIETGFVNGEAELEKKLIWDYSSLLKDEERQEALRTDVIEKLKTGQPVLLQGTLATDSQKDDPNAANNKGGAHMVVAYDYDGKNDQIIGHMGWKGTGTMKVYLDKAFESFDGFAWLDVKDTMQFTPKNYRFCWRSDIHAVDLDSHIHADELHRAKIDYGDSDYHALQCVCWDICYEEHSFDELVILDQHTHAYRCACGAISAAQPHAYGEIEMIDEHNHTLKCECGDVRYEEHAYDDVQRIDAITHVSRCACGSSVVEPHTGDLKVKYDIHQHAIKCRCGQIIGFEAHFYMQWSMTEARCWFCHQVKLIDPPFIIKR